MGVLATADFFIKPERADEFLEVLRGALPDTRAYDGCESIETYVDQDTPGHVLLIERWAARSNHEAYLSWRVEQGMVEVLADFFTAPAQFQYFEARADV